MRSLESRKRKVTIYDIAKQVGTSTATVSLVLNGTWRQYRVSADTAQKVLEVARALDYKRNMRARGLRLSQSGLAGMIIPHYRNRFFADLSEAFEAETRLNGLCPVVISTQREPAKEMEVVETLLAQQVEFIFITGVHNPETLNKLCQDAGTPCVNIDLPGSEAPSVVSDNCNGARQLTEAVIGTMISEGRDLESLRFVGGNQGDYATEQRLIGFKEALAAVNIEVQDDHVYRCGYSPTAIKETTGQLVKELGRLPEGMFINSLTALEGFIAFTSETRIEIKDRVVLGCFDWDPFAAVLPYSILMMRQDTDSLIRAAFAQVKLQHNSPYPFIKIPTIFQSQGK